MKLEKLSFREKVGYGFGDAASSMFWKLFGMYIMFFYTDIFGIPATIVGTMFLVTRLGDAAFDPLVGIMSDRTNTRWGKFRPFILFMAIPFGVLGVLTFTTPDFDMSGRIVYAFCTYSLMMLIYSMVNVPYESLMGVMTDNSKERMTLATYRFIFAFGGSFLVLGLFQPLFDGFGTNSYLKAKDIQLVEWVDAKVNTTSEKVYIVQNTQSTAFEGQADDSLLFVTAKMRTKSSEAFKIGVVNAKTNNYGWCEFRQGTDTLGLLRDGTTCDVKIKISSLMDVKSIGAVEDLKILYASDDIDRIKIDKIELKEIDYKFGTQRAVMVIAFIAVIFFFLTFLWTRERIKPVKEKTSLKGDLKDLATNIPWFILLGAGITTIFFNTIRDGAAIYYFKYYFQGQNDISFGIINTTFAISTIYLLIGQAANILGVTLAKPLSDRFGKKNTFLFAMAAASLFSFSFYFLGRTNITMMFTLQLLISLCAGIIFPLIWTMYADTADYSEWKNKRRATGLVFSAASMSQKFGASIGIASAGWLLAFYGYEANVAQSVTTQEGLRLMLSIIPGAGALISAICMIFYKLNDSYMNKISAELDERRSKD